MNKSILQDAYDICRKKFDIHIDKYEGIFEFGRCKNGDYYTESKRGNFFDMYNWMTSFIIGQAPIFYKTEKDNKYLKWAYKFAPAYRDKIFNHSLDTMHDIGFLYSPYSVEMYKLTGDVEHRETALKAADELLKRFDIKGKYIDAWGRMDDDERQGRAIIDCMMNIQLLFWAWKETGHTIYRDVAKAHADTTVKYFVREDYSVCHSFLFDRKNGEILAEANGCGYSNGSHWARGTAWMVYGLALTARYLEDKSYYDTAVKIAEKYIKCCGENVIPIWDFKLPEDMPAFECGHKNNPEWDVKDAENCKYNVDTSAAAIISCAMLELNKLYKNESLADFAKRTTEQLCNYINKDTSVAGILGSQNGHMTYMTFGDYFLLEALARLLYDTEVCW
ncbi:MAG: glycoside hydrolase family 88 protein [Clostridia bacterium]|nr:glycoside hydrolase family 88 protein [Clostridia bacterium]